MNWYVVLALTVVFFTATGQILLKIGSGQGKSKSLAPYLNLTTITAYALFFFVTLLSVIILEEIPLKLFYAFTSLNILLVIILSHIFLRESITKNHIFAVIIIMSGLIIFNLA